MPRSRSRSGFDVSACEGETPPECPFENRGASCSSIMHALRRCLCIRCDGVDGTRFAWWLSLQLTAPQVPGALVPVP
jgi:hypothetical protein